MMQYREERWHVTWEYKEDHRVRSFVWGEGAALASVGLRWGEGVKILCAQLAVDDLKAKKFQFFLSLSSPRLNLLWGYIREDINKILSIPPKTFRYYDF